MFIFQKVNEKQKKNNSRNSRRMYKVCSRGMLNNLLKNASVFFSGVKFVKQAS